ncbi:hypothetical protein [Methylobacterium trifolii]|nr:hypothetical protein [Methylobacterium trifolii]
MTSSTLRRFLGCAVLGPAPRSAAPSTAQPGPTRTNVNDCRIILVG